MDLLIIASIGIYNIGNDFYLQITTADKYNSYHVKISKEEAKELSERENIRVESLINQPEDSIGLAQSLQ